MEMKKKEEKAHTLSLIRSIAEPYIVPQKRNFFRSTLHTMCLLFFSRITTETNMSIPLACLDVCVCSICACGNLCSKSLNFYNGT